MEGTIMSKGVAIVTGGTRGIGLGIVHGLREAGYDVAATYHGDEEAAKKCEEETGAKCFKFDVANFSSCQESCAQIAEEMGDISVLVNNAGKMKDGFLHKMPEENWHDIIETNLTSCFSMCRAVVGGMRERGFGRIINISSINGQKGQIGQTNYAAAKAGILGFTKALAQESARKNITVNAICPGYIETQMTADMNQDILASIVQQIPVGHMGDRRDIADIVVFLASEKAGFITGSTITANGGQYMV